jgi:HYDIN/CFA65/VesB family protein
MLRMSKSTLIALLSCGGVVAGCDCGGGSLKDVHARLDYQPKSIDFGQVVVGDFRIAGLDIQNKGSFDLPISMFAITESAAEFSLPNGSPTALAPQEKKKIALSFSPTHVGKITGTLTIQAGKDTSTVQLTGEGVRSGARVTPEGEACGMTPMSLSFGQVVPGQSSDRAIKVEALGSAPLTVISAMMESGSSPAFSVDPIPTGTHLDPGGSFEIKAHYRPTLGGADEGAIVVVTDAPDSPTVRIEVCGQGVAPAVCADPVPLDFGAVANGSSKHATLHVKSCGLLPLDVSAIALSHDTAHATDAEFSISSPPALPATLAPGSAIDVDVEFAAMSFGGRFGYVEVDSNALGNTQAFFPIRATGAQPCSLSAIPMQVAWSNVPNGQTAQKNVVVQNSGASDCTVTGIQIASGAPAFALSSPPAVPLVVPSGGSTVLAIDYTPQGGMPDVGTLEIDEGSTPHNVDLTGNAPPPSGCQLEARPSFLGFGIVAVGGSRTMGLALHNLSSSLCTLHGAAIDRASSPGFSAMPPFGLIPPGIDLMVQVTYQPTAPGNATGVLHLDTSDVITARIDVPLSASAAPAGICVMPQLLNYGSVVVGNSSTLNFGIYACGANAVTVTGLDWTTPDATFTLVNPPSLPFTLQSGQQQQVTVRYAPTVSAMDRGVVTVRSNDAGSPAIDVVTVGNAFTPADAPVYIHTADTLYSYDPATNGANLIGTFSNISSDMTDIAIDLMGHLYGITLDGTIWTIDPHTAQANRLFALQNTGVGLTCLSNGQLVVGSDRLSIVDPMSGTVVRDIVGPNRFVTSGDVIALPDGQLYWSVERGSDRVIRVDPQSGATTQLSLIGATDVYGLGYANGQFLGFSNEGSAILLDSQTGAMTRMQSLPGYWNGATTNPVRW